jgi:hypothetical protein
LLLIVGSRVGSRRNSGEECASVASAAAASAAASEPPVKEDNDARLTREANAEVRHLGFNHIKIPMRRQLRELNELIQKDIACLKKDVEVEKMDHVECLNEMEVLHRMEHNVNKMALAIKFRMGAILARQVR